MDTKLTFTLPRELRKRIGKAAEQEGRKPSQFVRYHIGRILDEKAIEAANKRKSA